MTAPGHHRSTRDWIVDTILFLFAALLGVVTAAFRLNAAVQLDPGWLLVVDQVVGAASCVALWWRRRWPVELAVVLVVASVSFEVISGAMLVALFSVTVHRPPRTSLLVFGLSLLAAVGYVALRPDPEIPRYIVLALAVAVQGAATGWGLFVHHRRQLVLSLRDRAERAEAEAHLRAEQAQHQARDAIAREIHDVLGHRLSLLSVHAGALEFRPDAPAPEVAKAAAVIRESAHQALQDLREVIGVLRAPVGELPQPTFADLAQLVEESGRAGMRVDLRDTVDDIERAVPDSVGRTAYRIVQEGLTNARKHAPGTEVHVRVAGAPGGGLTVEVENTAPDAPGPEVPTGQGLIGLAERVAIAGGRLAYGPITGGGWLLAAGLPWPS